MGSLAMPPGNVYAQDVVDRGPWQFYYRVTTAANTATAAQYSLFVNQIGAGGYNKQDTNITKPNSIPPPQSFGVQSIGFVLGSGMLLSDIQSFLKNYYFEFRIGQKIFAEGPLHLWPGGAGVDGAVTTTATTTTVSAWNNGHPSILAMRRFPDFPRIIPANVSFFLNLITATTFTTATTGNGGTGVDVLAILDGILDREVQ